MIIKMIGFSAVLAVVPIGAKSPEASTGWVSEVKITAFTTMLNWLTMQMLLLILNINSRLDLRKLKEYIQELIMT